METIDKMIAKWEEKHHLILNEYSKGNTNNEVMGMYRTQLKNISEFIKELQYIKNNFIFS